MKFVTVNKERVLACALVLTLLLCFFGCEAHGDTVPPLGSDLSSRGQESPDSLIIPGGMTVKERFLPPEGFSRIEAEPGGFSEFLRELPLKPAGSKVKIFDGREKLNDVYLAVVDYTLGDRDLQQCADAVIRLRAEYLYDAGQYEKIYFNFVSGFTADFSKWSSGYGIAVSGNDVSWVNNGNNDNSYESFQKYLDIVYNYANTYSLENELVSKDISALAIGDVFIIGGFPGHCVIVVDMAVSERTGEKAFMLAQSYMPAQDIQILKGNSPESPWYTADIGEVLVTPEWTFEKSQLKTWQ